MPTITPTEFDMLCELVLKDSAIVLEAGKEYLVESRLAPLARRQGFESVGALVQQAVGSPRSPIRSEVIDAMTTNETSFFRDVHPWQTLREKLLPALIESRRASRQLSIWCAACSSGQEPYTLAILLREHFPDVVQSWQLSVLATDLSETMVKRTSEALYSQLEVNRGLPAPLLVRWFNREGASWRLAPEIRKMVEVRSANLAVPSTMPSARPFDLVFLRNVLIYFDDATKQRIVADITRRMNTDSYILFGSSEVSTHASSKLVREQADRTVYFRTLTC